MSTLQYNGNEYNILYIDGNIGASAGDGSTPAGALATIPSPLVDKTCYIIRRNGTDETVNVDMPQSWYESLQYIMFLGFPKADDPMYNLMEESAKTAWSSDTGTYARIRCNMASYVTGNTSVTAMNDTNNKTVFKTNSVRNFYSANCYFYRDGEGGNVGSDGRGTDFIFGFDYGSRFADITFNNCKFGYAQYNLENDDYIYNNSDVATDTSKYPQHKCCAYVGINNCNTACFNNCVINHVYLNAYTSYRNHWSSGAGKVIYISNTNKTIFSNIQYNVLYRNNYNRTDTDVQYYATRIYVTGDKSKVNFTNFELNKIYTSTKSVISTGAVCVFGYETKFDGVKVNQKIMGGGSLSSWTSIITRNKYFHIDGRNSLQVTNFYCNLSTSNLNMAPVLGLFTPIANPGNPNDKIQNIYIHLDDAGLLNQGYAAFYFEIYRGKWGVDGIESVTSNSEWEANAEGHQQTNAKAFIATNVTVYTKNSKDYGIYLLRSGVKVNRLEGRAYLGSATMDVKKHYVHISTTKGLNIYGDSYYKCDDFEANLNYPGYNGTVLITWQPQSKTSIYINKSNCLLTDEKFITPVYNASSNNSFVCPNYIKTGQFFQRNEVCFAKSWNTVRTGSNSQGSLRFNNNSADINNNCHPLIIGQDPYSGIQIVPSSIGKKILTAYIATKNMDVSEFGYTGRIGIHVNCPEKYTDYFDVEKQNTKLHEFTSEANGWQADNSSWSGDTNLNTFKCEIPIEVFTLEEPIDVKIWFNWYSVSGYLYVDPDFKVVDVI